VDAEQLKRAAAERAVGLIEDGMNLGLGTGSTARHVLQVIAERRARGELQKIKGVPTSNATRDLAKQLNIPVLTLDELPYLDMAIDGADEVDGELNLIKGLGGALLWEKIVESAAERLIIVVDESKLVERLGDRSPVPVEVAQFAWSTHLGFFRDLGADPKRREKGKEPFITDSGNFIIDCAFDDGISDPWRFDVELHNRAGVVESGLFLDMAEMVIVAGKDGVRTIERGEE
jgi:ribose 5-phosphate isomerase A